METARQAPAPAAPTAWTTFLDGITAGDPVKQKVLQRFAGYCLSHHCARRKFLVLEGAGPCGKSLFVKALAGLFPDGGTWAVAPDDLLRLDLQGNLCGKQLVAIEGWKDIIMRAPTFLRMVDGDYEVSEKPSRSWGPFTGKIVVAVGGMISLLIAPGPMQLRMIVVQLHRIHNQDIDPGLPAQLATDAVRYEIARWAHDGAVDLGSIPNGGFIRKEEPWLNNKPLIV